MGKKKFGCKSGPGGYCPCLRIFSKSATQQNKKTVFVVLFREKISLTIFKPFILRLKMPVKKTISPKCLFYFIP